MICCVLIRDIHRLRSQGIVRNSPHKLKLLNDERVHIIQLDVFIT